MSMPPVFSCELKFERARKHLQELQAECFKWNKSHANSEGVRVCPDPDAPDYLLVNVTVSNPPEDPISLLIADCIQNLRNALDHLVFTLANQHSGVLSEEDARASQFPIIGDESRKGRSGVGPDKFRDEALPMLKNVSPEAKAIIERLQPYQLQGDFRNHPLWVLSDLSNTDKHRTIHVAGCHSKIFGFTTSGSPPMWDKPFSPGDEPPTIKVFRTVINGETTIARLHRSFLPVIAVDSNMNMQIIKSVHVCFASGQLSGKDVIEELIRIFDFVANDVLDSLLPLSEE